jgi:hypothetical protein
MKFLKGSQGYVLSTALGPEAVPATPWMSSAFTSPFLQLGQGISTLLRQMNG